MGELRVLEALAMLLHKLSVFLGQLVAVLRGHSEGDGCEHTCRPIHNAMSYTLHNDTVVLVISVISVISPRYYNMGGSGGVSRGSGPPPSLFAPRCRLFNIGPKVGPPPGPPPPPLFLACKPKMAPPLSKILDPPLLRPY